MVLLELEAGDEVEVVAAGERLIHEVRAAGGTVRLLSTDRCGGDVREIATGAGRPQLLPSGEIVATTCLPGEDGGLVVRVDPAGDDAPVTLAEGVRCGAVEPWVDGFLALGHVEGQVTGPLLRHDGTELVELAASVRQLEVAPDGEHALALESDGRLLRFEPGSSDSEVVLTGAIRFTSGPGGGLLWQSLPAGGGTAPVHLRTRAGTDVTVADAYTPLSPPYDTFAWTADGEHAYLVGELGDIIGPWRASDAAPVDPPHEVLGGRWPYGSALADGSLWLVGHEGEDRLHLRWRPAAGETIELWREPRDTYPSASVIDTPDGLARILFPDAYAEVGVLTLYPHDGSAPRRLLEQAGRNPVLAAEHLVTVVADGDDTGTLVAVDLDGGEPIVLDRDVPLRPGPRALDGAVVYHTPGALMAVGMPAP